MQRSSGTLRKAHSSALGRRAYWLLVYLPLALMLTELHRATVDQVHLRKQMVAHANILAANASRPENIRVLQPLFVQALMDALPVGNKETRFLLGYGMIRFLSLLVTLCVAEKAFAGYGSLRTARMCVLLLVGMYPLSYLNYYYQPTSVLDLAFFTVGMYFLFTGRHWVLLPLVALATVNRNTSAFLCLAYGLYHLDALWGRDAAARLRFLVMCGALAGIWATEIFLLERTYPGVGWTQLPCDYLAYNGRTRAVWLYAAVMWTPLVAATWLGWREAPSRLKRLAIWVVPYVAVHFVMAQADEVRYWLPLYVALGPLCVLAYDRFADLDDAARAEP